MSWNYRVMAVEYILPEPFNRTDVMFEIREVYYNNKDIPDGYSMEIAKPSCEADEGIKGLKFAVDKYTEAIKKPILWAGDKFPEEYKPKKILNKK